MSLHKMSKAGLREEAVALEALEERLKETQYWMRGYKIGVGSCSSKLNLEMCHIEAIETARVKLEARRADIHDLLEGD